MRLSVTVSNGLSNLVMLAHRKNWILNFQAGRNAPKRGGHLHFLRRVCLYYTGMWQYSFWGPQKALLNESAH